MNKSIIDTDILSEILKGRDRTVAGRATEYRREHGRYSVTTITIAEVVKGFHRIRREDLIDGFLGAIRAEEVLSLDFEAGVTAGRVFADMERAGTPVGRADPLIAAIALRHDRVLVTGNLAHYERIRALGYPLRLENWRG